LQFGRASVKRNIHTSTILAAFMMENGLTTIICVFLIGVAVMFDVGNL